MLRCVKFSRGSSARDRAAALRRRAGGWLAAAIAATGILWGGPARADETGSGHYTPGAFGYLAGVIPPRPGAYFSSFQCYYNASAHDDRFFPIGGKVRSGVKTELFAQILDGLWVTGTKIFGGRLASTVMVPLMYLDNTALSATNSRVNITEGTNFNLGDLYVAPVILGWDKGDFHWSVMGGIYAPSGEWQLGQLAPIGKNYWSLEPSLGFTYLSAKSGWEVSTRQGADFNSRNQATDYQSGIDYHLDWVLAKHVMRPVFPAPPAAHLRGQKEQADGKAEEDGDARKAVLMDVAPGIGGYWYYQLTDDTGSGAVLGPFKGRVLAIGPTLLGTANFAGRPLAFQLKVLREFYAEHRLLGVSSWADLSFKF